MRVEIELDDELFAQAALIAHNMGMTFNEFANMALESYIHEIETDRTVELEDALVDAVANFLTKGVTVETVRDYGNAYERWFHEAVTQTTLNVLIQSGFDKGDAAERSSTPKL